MNTQTLPLPKTLQEAISYFSDPQRTFDYAVRLRWSDGKITCPRCEGENHSFISTRRIWFCKGCKKQFTVKVGTIFEDSALGMDKWMIAVWMITNCKNGISSYEIHRALGITQKSAWLMLHRVRLAMHEKETGTTWRQGPRSRSRRNLYRWCIALHAQRTSRPRYHGQEDEGQDRCHGDA